jgi:hypothetical protein
MVMPDKRIGIVCEPVNEKGVLRVQVAGKKIWINHKRVKLHVRAEELYPEDYDFSVEEVELSIGIKLPATFICKDCGRELPIKDYYVSTYCPDSWNTGVCPSCIGRRKREERERMFGDRNKRGVFDYDSL